MVQVEWLKYSWYRVIAIKSILFVCIYVCVSFYISRKHNDKLLVRLWSLSLLLILVFTVLFRYKFVNVGIVMQVGKSILTLFNNFNPRVLVELVCNMLLFVPYGCCTKLLFERRIYCCIALLVTPVLIELMQLWYRIGFFEMDDILMNSMGITLGFAIVHLSKRIQNER